MSPQESIDAALSRCPDLITKSLEEFLNSMLDENLEALAQMPGTPGQVMSAQFTHYVRSSVPLTECQRRNTAQAQRIMETVMRMAVSKRTTKRREAQNGSNTSCSQTIAA
jgi:hypothetical protein